MKSLPHHLFSSFIAFAEAKNMNEAAARVGLAQPTITNHLRELEQAFPQPLFEMNGRKKVLTAFGAELLQIVQKRWRGLESDIKDLADQSAKAETVHLRVAGRAEVLRQLAPGIAFPGRVEFIPTDGNQAVEGLLEKRYDLAISNHLSKAGALHARKIFTDRFFLAAPRTWFKNRTPSLADALLVASAKPFLAYKLESPELASLFRKFGLSVSPAKVLPDWEVLIRMVAAQQGWTAAPENYFSGHSEIIKVPIPTDLVPETAFYLLYYKRIASAPWFKQFKYAVPF